jgi:hypothetical protein
MKLGELISLNLSRCLKLGRFVGTLSLYFSPIFWLIKLWINTHIGIFMFRTEIACFKHSAGETTDS